MITFVYPNKSLLYFTILKYGSEATYEEAMRAIVGLNKIDLTGSIAAVVVL